MVGNFNRSSSYIYIYIYVYKLPTNAENVYKAILGPAGWSKY